MRPVAADTADVFLKREHPLLDWGNGVVRSKEKEDAIAAPVAVLVDHETVGAAEALAAILRETGAGLVLGSKTAGRACIEHEYPLQNGQKLRIAAAPVMLGDGSALPTLGLKPDITIEVRPQDERAYFAEALKAPPATNAALVAGARLHCVPGA